MRKFLAILLIVPSLAIAEACDNGHDNGNNNGSRHHNRAYKKSKPSIFIPFVLGVGTGGAAVWCIFECKPEPKQKADPNPDKITPDNLSDKKIRVEVE